MVKVGMIGTSVIAKKFVQAAKFDKRCSIEVIYSRDMKRAEKFKEQNGVKRATDSMGELLTCGLDIIYIATPNKIHYKQVKTALEHEINVLVEKPITVNKHEVTELYSIAKENKLILIEAVKTMSMNTYQELKKHLDLIGKVVDFNLNIMRCYENYPTKQDDNIANIYKKELDGGVISDLGSYAFYPLIDLLNQDFKIEEISKYQEDYLEVETQMNVKLKSDLCMGKINLSMKNQGENISTIRGELGYVTIDSLSQFNQIVFYNNDHQEILKIDKDHQHMMQREISHLIDLIEQKQIKSPIYTMELALKVQNLMENLHK